MIEVKLLIDEIDYNGIAELVIPIIKEKFSQNEGFLSNLIENYIPTTALNGALNGFLDLLTNEQKDEIAISLINRYDEKIIQIMQQIALNKGIDVKIKGLSVDKINDLDKSI